MPRPQKNNCDYFPHDSDMRNHRKVKAIRSKFGPIGYCIWSMFLEYLASADGNRVESTDLEYELIAGDFGVSVTEIRNVVDYCVTMELLFIEEKNSKSLIYSKTLDERLAPVYAKREKSKNRVSVQKRRDDGRFGYNNTEPHGVSVTETPQKKRKERKVKESSSTSSKSSTNPKGSATNPPSKESKPPVLGYAGCMEIYDEWIKSITGIGAKINGAEGNALKSIIEYLKSQLAKAGKIVDEKSICDAFEFVLKKRDRWDKYHQDKLKLMEINSNFINIINAIRNGTGKQKSDNSFSESLSELRKEGSL